MDGRHEYVLSTVADKLQMTIEDAEEFMLDGDQVRGLRTLDLPFSPSRARSLSSCFLPHCLQLKHFDSFFQPGGTSSLLFYYQPPTPQEGEKGRLCSLLLQIPIIILYAQTQYSYVVHA